jgi:phage shock protein A
MSVLNGPGEGTWSVFAMKVVEERDEARAEVERLRTALDVERESKRVLDRQVSSLRQKVAAFEAEAEEQAALWSKE